MTNPLTAPFETPFGIPPFGAVQDHHFEPAFEQAMAAHLAEIEAIAGNPDPATFENTIDALERAGSHLRQVAGVFFNLAGTDATDGIKAVQRNVSPRLAAHRSEIMLNQALFARVDALAADADTLALTDEQRRVLDLTLKDFERAGARLDQAGRARLKAIAQESAQLGTTFGQNVQKDEEDWHLALSSDDLDGLPEFVISAARGAAAERGMDGHIVTLSRSLIVPFLQFSPRRDLRQQAFEAWAARGDMREETRTIPQITALLALRQERAQLLGYDTYAAYRLEPEMAKTPDAVRDLLMAVWTPARAQAERDAEKLTQMLHEDGVNDDLAPWDWRFYAARLQKAEHDIDEAEIKPYLQLDKMIEAAFDCATRLFGLTFAPLDIPLHHPDARAWECRKGDRHMGIFIGDYFNRAQKRSGAWCSRYRGQSKLDGEERPIVQNTCNFAKPQDGQPALLTFDDARTLFHEFGHALHGLMSDVTYPSISGTSVAQDFVELPSQLYEHWLGTPQVLSQFAVHADTGAPMPAALLDRLLAAENFDQGFATVEYVASALVDLDFHTSPPPADPMARQRDVLADLGMPSAITMRHASPHFLHVFSGDGYASAYYSYMWSEVMDAAAFAAFEGTGDVFDPTTADALARHIYSAGGSRDAEDLYKAFRGRMPGVEALLKQRGLAA